MAFTIKILKKALLWLITGVIPVVVAACYGVMYAFNRNGKVVDADTGEAIQGIQVSCAVGNRSNVIDTSYTDSLGNFYIAADTECDAYIFTDVDGDENGAYQEVVIQESFPDGSSIEMPKAQ
jgi:putative lipoprotein (rSAM/lipoprotein system)